MDRKVIVATIATLAIGAAGCGSSTPLTSAELTRQANAICRHLAAQAAVLRRQHPANLRALIVAAVPIETKMVNDLSKLKPPKSARSAYERFVAIQKVNLAGFKRLATGRRAGNADESNRIHELWRLTEQLHVTDCR